MEPPGEGRYEPLAVRPVLGETKPQWSRPVKGGTRSTQPRHPVPVETAAMEPPGEGRYESLGGLAALDLHPAAMEPPGEGRYESVPPGAPRTSKTPQWSRPVKGGTSGSRRSCATPFDYGRNGAAR